MFILRDLLLPLQQKFSNTKQGQKRKVWFAYTLLAVVVPCLPGVGPSQPAETTINFVEKQAVFRRCQEVTCRSAQLFRAASSPKEDVGVKQ